MRTQQISFLSALLAMVAFVGAAAISVPNFSFESPDRSELGNGPTDDWTDNAGSGNFDPNNTFFPGSSGDNAPLAPPAQGGQVGYTNNLTGPGPLQGELTQTLTAVVTSGSAYYLTVAVGQDAAGNALGNYDIELLAGATVIAIAPVVVPAPGTFLDTNALSPYFAPGHPLIGQALTIRIAHDAGASPSQNYYDNVRLNEIPEPASLGLLAMGALAMLRRRK